MDQYVSGKSQQHMKEFQRMVQDAQRNHFQRIYCRRVDRFGRNLNEMINRYEEQGHDLGEYQRLCKRVSAYDSA